MQTKEQWMAQLAKATRIIGIVPRVKAKADQEPSPTTLAIWDCEKLAFRPKFALDDEQSELDFVLGCMPVRWRKVTEGEDLTKFKEHHVRSKKDPTDETKKRLIPDEVPSVYDGLKKSDVLTLSLGGSGDYFAFALSRQAEEVGALVLRCPPFQLKAYREELVKADPKNVELDDSIVLAKMVMVRSDSFYPVFVRERKLTWMRECYRRRIDIMKARIACEQRLRQRFIGKLFCSAEGKFPEGAIEKAFDADKSADAVLNSLVKEEASADLALLKALEALPVYNEVFGQVEGAGPGISSRLIAAIQDIRRFETKWKLRKFCGVHCTVDGQFPRRRVGMVAEGNPDCRKGLFLLGDQFNRRPSTVWGVKFRANKVYYRTKHPVPVEVDKRCVQFYRGAFNIFRRYGIDISQWDSITTWDVDTVYGFVKAGSSKMNEMVEAGKLDCSKLTAVNSFITKLDELVESKAKSTGETTVFSPKHIHRMALWKTAGEFVEWLFEEWWKLEKAQSHDTISTPKEPVVDPAAGLLWG